MAFAAATVQTAQLQVDGNSLTCVLGYPDAVDGGQEVELLLAPVPTPQAGLTVQVRYVYKQAVYQYLTTLQGTTGPTRWRLAAPRVVERSERRLSERVEITEGDRFSLQVHYRGEALAVAIHDLSPAGVSVEVPADLPWTHVGARLEAVLTLPEGAPIDVGIEVRNHRPHPSALGMVLGARLTTPHVADVRRIAEAVAAVQAR
jgi:hypothetical protein